MAATMVGVARPGGAQEVIEQLYSQNPKARVAALRELGSMGEAGAQELESARRAFELFSDSDYSVQVAAILALASMGSWATPYAEEVALMAASSSDKEVKQSAIQALGYIGGEDQVKTVEGFLSDKDLDLVVDACQSLGWMGSASNSCYKKLEEKLKEKDPAVVAAASASLCNLGAETATLAKALQGDAKVKVAVLSVLAKKAPDSGVPDELVTPIAACVGDQISQVRISAASIICILGEKAASQAPALGKLLSSSDIGVRACAATALAGLGEAASSQSEPLKKLLKDDCEDTSTLVLSIAGVQPKVNANLRKPACAAAAAIAAMGPKGYALASAVAEEMASKDFEMRMASLQAVGSMGEAGALYMDDAMKLIEDPAPLVTAHACLALGNMAESSGATSAATEKVAECLKDKLPIVRGAACKGLAKMGEEATNYLDVLVKCLTDETGSVRAAACMAVAGCGEMGQMYASDICRLIYDPDVNVRVTAVQALTQMGERGSAFAEEIASLLDDPNPAVQNVAFEALQKFGPEIANTFLGDLAWKALEE